MFPQQPSKRIGRSFWQSDRTLFCAMLGFAALFSPLVYIGLRDMFTGISSRSWPKAPGVVERAAAGRFSAHYQVDGVKHSTPEISFDSGEDRDDLLNRLRFPDGAKVLVSYQPSDPGFAVLRPGFRPNSLVVFLIGFVLTSFFLAFALGGQGRAGQVFGGLFAGIGFALLAYGGVNVYRGNASNSWPTTQGQILYSQVEDVYEALKSPTDVPKKTGERAVIAYRYDAAGQPHVSGDRRWGQTFGSSDGSARRIVSQYPEGKTVSVAYSPVDLDMAVLEAGVGSEAYWLPGAGLVVMIFGVICVIVMRS